ncbi:MAG: KH domain-containing protein [Fusobacteriaceae bacterium]|jgi:spoIIIJ-associated protein|nr:KH domain-containing protein [Fusobacteriaceae bacterium]
MAGKTIVIDDIKAMTKEEAVERALNIAEAKPEHIVAVTEVKKGRSSFFGLFTSEGIYSVEIDKTRKPQPKAEPQEKKKETPRETAKDGKKDLRKEEKREGKRDERKREKPVKTEKSAVIPDSAPEKSDKAAFFDAIHDEGEDMTPAADERYEDITESLAEKTRAILEKMGLVLNVNVTKLSERNYLVEIFGEDNGIIIGKKGKTLNSFEYLLKSIFKKYRIEVDVEGFKEKRYDTLKKLSKKMAEKVLKTGKTVKLNPMPARERKIIHEVMNKYPQIDTFSEGREPNRFIIIKKKR